MPPHEIKQILGVIAALLAVGANVPYVISIWRGKTKPHLFSWIIWALINAIVAAAQYSAGAGTGMWVTVVSCLTSLSISIVAIYCRADVKFKKSDWIAFILALAALPLWVLTKDPFAAALMSTLANLLAYFVVVTKIWDKPDSENALSYFLHGVKWLAGIAALEAITPATLVYPGVFMLVNVISAALIVWRSRMIRKK